MKRENKRTRAGFTLVELCVVIALLAIVTTLVTSFTVLMSNRVKRATRRNDMISELFTAETAVQQWIRHYDNIDFKFQSSTDNTGLRAVGQPGSADQATYTLSLSSDGARILCGGLADRSIQYIRGLEFHIKQAEGISQSSGRYIIQCIITYDDPTDNTDSLCSSNLIFTTHSGAEITE